MRSPLISPSSRRVFLKTSGQLAAAGTLAGVALPRVHAAGSDQIRIALVGCGGRGSGAARDAMQQSGPPKLVAMADIFEHRMKASYAAHTGQEVTLEEFLNHEHEYAPGVDKLTFDSPAPVQVGKDGRYPVPEPGIKKNREH